MKRILTSIAILCLTICSQATTHHDIENASPDIIMEPPRQPEIEVTRADRKKVVELLNKAKSERGNENPIIYFAKQFIGTPYVAHTLEKGDEEHLIVNIHEMDCTTFVEYVLALAICDKNNLRSFQDFCDYLTLIRYRRHKLIEYPERNHYFTWWAESNINKNLVKDIAPSINEDAKEPFTAIQTINIDYMTKHPNQYKQLDKGNKKNYFFMNIANHEKQTNGQQYRYIPKANLNKSQSSALGIVHSGDIVAMLTDSDGLDTRHIGIAYWQKGKLHLLHASSLAKKVLISKETFYQYEKKQKKHIGIRVFRMQ